MLYVLPSDPAIMLLKQRRYDRLDFIKTEQDGDMSVGRKLGIYVSSDQHIDALIRLCRAAKKKDVEIYIFLTHIATRLSKDPRFDELSSLAQIALCAVSFEYNQLEKPVEGLVGKGFSSQVWHIEQMVNCDRYITF